MRIHGLIFAALLVAGCAENKNDRVGKNDSSARNGQQAFDQTQDPPLNAETRYAAGQLAEAQNRPAQAIEQYKAAIKADPKHRLSMYRLATVYAQQKMYPDSIATWQRYIEATDGSAEGYNNLAFTYEVAGQEPQATSAYQKCLALYPHDEGCRVNYGTMLARQGNLPEAIAQLQAVLTPAQAHYDVGVVLEEEGNKGAAIAEYRKAIELDPNLKDAQGRLMRLK